MTYTMSFFLLTSGITHVALWYHKDIIRQTKEMLAQVDEAQPDIHNELMKAYPDIPEWMYLAWLGFWVVVMILVGLLTPFKLPWWGVFFGLALALVFIVPSGIVQGSSGLQIPLNIITQLTMGLLVPGQTVPVMTFKSYGYNIMIQALNLSSDLKIGHYLHINPLHMVFSQIWGTFVGAVTNTAAVWIAIAYFPLDTPDWRYTGHTTFYNAGAIWGAIGPARFFGPSSPYFSLNLGYLLGILPPFLPWTANKLFPHPYWRFVHFPVLATIVQPGNPGSIVFSTLILAFIFQYLVFTYAHGWWVKYNYVLAAALDSGAAIGVLVATFTYIQIPGSESAVNPGLPDFYCTGRAWGQGVRLSEVRFAAEMPQSAHSFGFVGYQRSLATIEPTMVQRQHISHDGGGAVMRGSRRVSA
ncbi:OPT superfamily [Polyrhizophydium stewartii]|uniref:OPT superfamily n=1 Tax=Polyrhizophydium stewartii TaxID=2732419 RepID=A0ABR4NCK5_9FUNG